MRISEYYRLGKTQPALDFVDVDVRGDTTLFVDPHALLLYDTDWGQECVSLLQNFFGSVLDLIGRGANPLSLLGELHEPNETRLGLSVGRAQGRGLGLALASDVARALERSEAVKSGLLRDLEETILMIPGVGPDLISDIATNVIREPLLNYTCQMSNDLGLPLATGIYVGPIWNPDARRWITRHDEVLMADERPLVLVPKAIVRRRLDFDADEYFRHVILPHLRAQELDAGSELVELLKNGKSRVTNDALIEKYGRGKTVNARETVRTPRLIDDYRREKEEISEPLTHEGLAEVVGTPLPDWERLLQQVLDVPPGQADANAYHEAVQSLLTALFSREFSNPRKEQPLHGGRKRIDIVFANLARRGFFWWLKQHYSAAHVIVEVKNYSNDIGNEELDQLAGRFSPSRGLFGLLVSRSFQDKARFVATCRDTANDHRGFIIALDDGDLRELVRIRREQDEEATFDFLKRRFDELVM